MALACQAAGALFSSTAPMNPHVAAAIQAISDDAWQPIRAAVVSTVTLRLSSADTDSARTLAAQIGRGAVVAAGNRDAAQGATRSAPTHEVTSTCPAGRQSS